MLYKTYDLLHNLYKEEYEENPKNYALFLKKFLLLLKSGF